MAYNGSGVFSTTNTFVYDTVISETAVNQNFTDIATGLSTAITKDGQTVVTANIPMASNKFTGLTAGSAATDSATLGQVQAQAYAWAGTAAGTADVLTASPSPAITAYAAGQAFRFVAASDNTGTATIAINGLAAKAIQNDGSALAAADIATGKIYEIVYDGTQFQISRARIPSTDYLVSADIGVTVQGYDANNTLNDVVNTFTAAQSGSITALTSTAASIAVDAALNNHFSHTLTENTTLANPTNLVAGTSGSFFVTQHASSPKTLAFGGYYKFAGGTAPTITAVNSAEDRIDYIVRTTTSIECVWTGAIA